MYQPKPLIPLLLAAFLLTGCQSASPPFECTDAIGCVEIAPGDPIKIGALQTLRTCLKRSGTSKLAHHNACHGDVNESFTAGG